jgi:hypothetical protein
MIRSEDETHAPGLSRSRATDQLPHLPRLGPNPASTALLVSHRCGNFNHLLATASLPHTFS